ncbi:NAD(P)-binding protein [Bradyrhizobium sp. 166]|uniref:NAD(P)-binding protein n=1 Tax=Bradyrhizobium sp. 166 TaxID=2782638 RepID=UPI001FF93212|nr:NAD(P)-binding protein [Bradyrhizobium sp. 166]
MRAVIVGAGMGGLMTALALRQSGVFASVDVYEQTKVPSTAGAGLNIPPNGARICRWLGVDLDGGDSKGPDGVIDGGRAAILESTRQFNADGSVTKRPFDHVTAAGDGAGFHHMHRLDLLMCLYKRVSDFGIDSGAPCPIAVHMDCRLTQLRQAAGEGIATFSNGRTATGELLVGADGINSATLQLAWPNSRPKRWTEVTCFRGLIPRTGVASLRKANGNPLDHNPINSFSMDRHRADRSGATTYWVRGGELLNVWIAHYEPESAAFEQEEGDWFPVSQQEIVREVGEAFAGHPSRDDLIALSGAIVRPTKWGLYDRDALETWVQGRICLLGDAAHPMLPTSVKELLSPSKTPPPLPAPLRFTSAMCLQPCCTTNACGITALPAFNWDPNLPSTICERRTPLSRRRYWRDSMSV